MLSSLSVSMSVTATPFWAKASDRHRPTGPAPMTMIRSDLLMGPREIAIEIVATSCQSVAGSARADGHGKGYVAHRPGGDRHRRLPWVGQGNDAGAARGRRA